ncbi:MAG: heme-binding protein [Hyphomicrobiales bacterium]|nr:heme-binding protein [Hyphomicrobiales bacterium]
MKACSMLAVAALLALAAPARAEDATVSYKALSPELAFDAAKAAMQECRQHGYQVAVAIVDRFGTPQAMLRDRFAGPHTTPTATGKAWTAASFKMSTQDLAASTQTPAMQGLRQLPNVVAIGGGVMIESGGTLLGAIGVSGAPGGDADEACAKAGITAIADRLDF